MSRSGIPKQRTGSFFPELLEPRRRIAKALWAVIMAAYITGTSTRKVDDWSRRSGVRGHRRLASTLSRICKATDDDVAVLRTRRLDHQPFVYVWLDATYVHLAALGGIRDQVLPGLRQLAALRSRRQLPVGDRDSRGLGPLIMGGSAPLVASAQPPRTGTAMLLARRPGRMSAGGAEPV